MFKDKLMEELKKFMKERDKDRKEVVQLVIAKAQGFAKDELVEVSDSHFVRALKSEIKQMEGSLSEMRDNLTDEKVKSYETKIELLTGYLPTQLREEEIKDRVLEKLNELSLEKSMKSMGVLMKECNKCFGDMVDGKLLSSVVRELLS